MKLRFLTSISGAPGSFHPGEIGEWPDDDAKGLISAGYAEPISKPEVRETADRKPPARRAK